MKRILSLDPGHTTGIAVYNEEGVLEMSIAVPASTIQKGGFVFALNMFTRPEIVLIESLPVSYIDKLTKEVWYAFMSRLTVIRPKLNVVQIQPSQWKNLTTRVEIPGQHTRDAATMAKWYIEKERLLE